MAVGIRMAIFAAVGVLAGISRACSAWPVTPLTVGWDVAVAVLLGWIGFTVWPMGSEATAAYATRKDPTRAVTEVIQLPPRRSAWPASACLAAGILSQGSAQDPARRVGVLTLALSWFAGALIIASAGGWVRSGAASVWSVASKAPRLSPRLAET
jgi:hypothetical protein